MINACVDMHAVYKQTMVKIDERLMRRHNVTNIIQYSVIHNLLYYC